MSKPILISISPNTDKTDALLALKLIFTPSSWQKGQQLNLLSSNLKKLFKTKHCWLLNAGRNSLYLALQILDLKKTDEVLCQAFTCVAVPNAIQWAGAKPVYVDTVKNGFNIDPIDLIKKITPNTKALIIQHTFGQPDKVDKIKKICQENNIILIEDCAHSLGAKYQDKLIGTFGDLTVLSFGRDKVISSVFGGALLTSNKTFAKKINQSYQQLELPSASWTFKQLLHPIIMALIVPTYYTFNFGKLLLFIYQKTGLLSFPVSKKEKTCQMSLKSQKLPNALAVLALYQLNKLKQNNQKRQQIAGLYQQAFNLPPALPGSIYLRFPLLVKNPQQLITQAKKHKIILGDWYRPIIAPKGVKLPKVSYKQHSCPNAEKVSQAVINLPTHPKMTLQDAKRVVKIIKSYVNN